MEMFIFVSNLLFIIRYVSQVYLRTPVWYTCLILYLISCVTDAYQRYIHFHTLHTCHTW